MKPRYNGNESKGEPDITIKEFNPNALRFQFFIRVTGYKRQIFQAQIELLYRGPTVRPSVHYFLHFFPFFSHYTFPRAFRNIYSGGSIFLELCWNLW